MVRSGLRASTPTIPNAIALLPYATLSLSIFQTIARGTQLRLNVLNATCSGYGIRNGTGLTQRF